MSRIFNRYRNQLVILFGRLKFFLACVLLIACFSPLFVFSQSLPVIDNSSDLLGLTPININNYVQCTIKYLQNSSSLIKEVQEKNNKISFYQKSLKELIEIYNKLYNSNQLNEAQELIQEIQKIRIFSSRLSRSLEISINLNKEIIRETQKKSCHLNKIQSIEISQSNIVNQSNFLEIQLSNILEKAYRLISQTQFKKSQQLISDLNSSSSVISESDSSSSKSSSGSEIISSSSIYIDTQSPAQKIIPKIDRSISQSSSSESASSESSTGSATSSSSLSSTSPTSTSSSATSSSPVENSSISSSVSSSGVGVISPSSSSFTSSSSSSLGSSSSLVLDEDLGSLASDKPISQSSSSVTIP